MNTRDREKAIAQVKELNKQIDARVRANDIHENIGVNEEVSTSKTSHHVALVAKLNDVIRGNRKEISELQAQIAELVDALSDYEKLVLFAKEYYDEREANKMKAVEMYKDLVRRFYRRASVINKLKDANKSLETKNKLLKEEKKALEMKVQELQHDRALKGRGLSGR
jgi:chromosome segregation ATPase